MGILVMPWIRFAVEYCMVTSHQIVFVIFVFVFSLLMLRAGEEGSRPLIWLVSLVPVLYAHSLGFPCIVRSAHPSGVTGYLKMVSRWEDIWKWLSEAIYRQERPTLAVDRRGVETRVTGLCTRSWYGSFSFICTCLSFFLSPFFFTLGRLSRSIAGFRICATKSQWIPKTMSTPSSGGKSLTRQGGTPTLGSAMPFFHSNLVSSLIP